MPRNVSYYENHPDFEEIEVSPIYKNFCFAGCTETVEEIFGAKPLSYLEMQKILSKYIEQKGVSDHSDFREFKNTQTGTFVRINISVA